MGVLSGTFGFVSNVVSFRNLCYADDATLYFVGKHIPDCLLSCSVFMLCFVLFVSAFFGGVTVAFIAFFSLICV